MSACPCEHCQKYYDETEDTYCTVCGFDCCEDCLDGQWCPECLDKHRAELAQHKYWQKLTDAERNEAIRKAI